MDEGLTRSVALFYTYPESIPINDCGQGGMKTTYSRF